MVVGEGSDQNRCALTRWSVVRQEGQKKSVDWRVSGTTCSSAFCANFFFALLTKLWPNAQNGIFLANFWEANFSARCFGQPKNLANLQIGALQPGGGVFGHGEGSTLYMDGDDESTYTTWKSKSIQNNV